MHGHLTHARKKLGLQDRTFSFALPGEAAVLEGNRALLDPELTAVGETQAAALAEALRPRERQFDILVTSPLRNALQTTARIAATQDAAEVIVTALHTETALPGSEDTAPCRRGALAAAEVAARYPRWDVAGIRAPRDWLHADGGWFAPRAAEDRLADFRAFLNELPPHKDVLVVGHAAFLRQLLGADQRVGACEVVTRALDGGTVAPG